MFLKSLKIRAPMKEGLTLEDLYSPGLEGIPACHSRIGYIDGVKGILEYQGYRIEELAKNSTFEETTYLLLHGKLPTSDELNAFDWDLRKHRRLKFQMLDVIKSLPEDGHPMDALQTCVAALGLFYPEDTVADPQEAYQAI